MKTVEKYFSTLMILRIQVKNRETLLNILLIIIIGFIAYSNSFTNELILDDNTLVKDNVYIKNPSNITQIFTKDIAYGGGQKWNSYRPIQMITYMVDYAIWKLNVLGYRITNTLIHIFVALTVYCLVNILYKDKLLSLLTSLFFVSNPLHIGSVTYISGRADSLAALFMLISLIFYIKHLYLRRGYFYIFSLIAYILAFLSKENTLVLPLVLLLYHYTFKKRFLVSRFIPILGVTFVYILLRLTLLKSLLSNVAYNTSTLQRLPGFFVAIANYIRLLFLPFGLHIEYGRKLFNLTNPQAIAGILIVSFLVIYAIRSRNRNNLSYGNSIISAKPYHCFSCIWRAKQNNLVFFSISWFFVTLLPQSNIYPLNAYMAEHWLYLPSIGFFLILARFLSRTYYALKNIKVIFFIATIGLLYFYCYLTIKENYSWRDPIVFYKKTLLFSPESSKIINNLAVEYSNLGRKEDALGLYNKLIKEDPGYMNAYNNMGLLYYESGNKKEAAILYKKAIEINSEFPDTYNNLGNIYGDFGNYEDAIKLYKKAIGLNPNYPVAYYNMGIAYSRLGNRYDAISYYKKAIGLKPDYVDAYNNLGLIYYEIGRIKEAFVLYKKAIDINPNYANAYNNMAVTYRDAGNYEKAIELYKKAITLKPDYIDAHYNLALIYHNLGKKEDAIVLYKKVIKIDPKYIKAYNNLAIAYYDEKQYDLAIKYCDMAIALGYQVDAEFLEFLKPHRR